MEAKRMCWAVACCLVGCKSWQSVPSTRLGPSSEPVLVVTADRAYEYQVTGGDNARVVGKPRRAWSCTTCDVKVDGEGEAPAVLEDKLGWKRMSIENGEPMQLPRASIVAASRYAYDRETTLIRVGIIVGVAALIVIGSLTLTGDPSMPGSGMN
jgi:hypothetical protein